MLYFEDFIEASISTISDICYECTPGIFKIEIIYDSLIKNSPVIKEITVEDQFQRSGK